jgi:hypothetical protein
MTLDESGRGLWRPTQVLTCLICIVGAVLLLALGLFCGFGFLASFEPGNGLEWKAAYGALSCLLLAGAIASVRCGVKPQSGRSERNQ